MKWQRAGFLHQLVSESAWQCLCCSQVLHRIVILCRMLHFSLPLATLSSPQSKTRLSQYSEPGMLFLSTSACQTPSMPTPFRKFHRCSLPQSTHTETSRSSHTKDKLLGVFFITLGYADVLSCVQLFATP